MLYIFDKDNTLVESVGNRPANTVSEQKLMKGVKEKCGELIAEGHTLAVASNQGGVAFGILTEAEANELVSHAANLIGAVAFECCPFHPKGRVRPYNCESEDRKPNPGMLNKLIGSLAFNKADTVYIGDMETDKQAAEAAGVAFCYAHDFFKQ